MCLVPVVGKSSFKWNRAKSTAEKLPVLKELEAFWRKRLSQQKCSDVEKELRAI